MSTVRSRGCYGYGEYEWVSGNQRRGPVPHDRVGAGAGRLLVLSGAILIVPVDGTDFSRAINVMADYASLAHLTTFLVIVAMLLHGYGLLGLFRLPTGKAALCLPCCDSA